MNAFDSYERSLFDAFVWSQAVEELLRGMVISCHFAGNLKLSPKQRKIIIEKERATFGCLTKLLKRHLGNDLHERLERLVHARNEIVHRSNYVTTKFPEGEHANFLQDEYVLESETKDFQEVASCAQHLCDELRVVWRKLEPLPPYITQAKFPLHADASE